MQPTITEMPMMTATHGSPRACQVPWLEAQAAITIQMMIRVRDMRSGQYCRATSVQCVSRGRRRKGIRQQPHARCRAKERHHQRQQDPGEYGVA